MKLLFMPINFKQLYVFYCDCFDYKIIDFNSSQDCTDSSSPNLILNRKKQQKQMNELTFLVILNASIQYRHIPKQVAAFAFA